MSASSSLYSFFFFNDTATTEIYTLSLHDALPIFAIVAIFVALFPVVYIVSSAFNSNNNLQAAQVIPPRSEEHTSELQSLTNLVCRLLLEKKKNTQQTRQDNVNTTHTDTTKSTHTA